jgi:hypothetical protein
VVYNGFCVACLAAFFKKLHSGINPFEKMYCGLLDQNEKCIAQKKQLHGSMLSFDPVRYFYPN